MGSTLFIHARASISVATASEALTTHGITLVTDDDARYPLLLKKSFDPPVVLFVRGTLPASDTMAIGVVGSRGMTAYGNRIVDLLVPPLARAGLAVISGLALGVDGAAHRAVIAAGGCTVAVLGSGIDAPTLYPREHRTLADEIVASGGAVVSEYPPGTQAARHRFPERNRVIAGWSAGVLVVEAREGSGALITAKFALEEGREVFAVPGPITSPNAYGPHMLIARGACLATNAATVLQTLGIEPAAEISTPALDERETKLFTALDDEPQHIDALAQALQLDIAEAAGTLALMEMRGIVRNVGMMHYVRVK